MTFLSNFPGLVQVARLASSIRRSTSTFFTLMEPLPDKNLDEPSAANLQESMTKYLELFFGAQLSFPDLCHFCSRYCQKLDHRRTRRGRFFDFLPSPSQSQ